MNTNHGIILVATYLFSATLGFSFLAMPWVVSKLGWVAGPLVVVVIGIITVYTSSLIADSCQYMDLAMGLRNQTYVDTVRVHLGRKTAFFCALAQFRNMMAVGLICPLIACLSIQSAMKPDCLTGKGKAECNKPGYYLGVGFMFIQILLSQFENMRQLVWLTAVTFMTSLVFVTISIALLVANAGGSGTSSATELEPWNVWNLCQAISVIAFAQCASSTVFVEAHEILNPSYYIQKEMKAASVISILTVSLLYILCGCLGFSALGYWVPQNFLLDGYLGPYWLRVLAEVVLGIYMIGLYQVYSQPLFKFVEGQARVRLPSNFTSREVVIFGKIKINWLNLTWRSAYVILTTSVGAWASFSSILVQLSVATTFWPLNVKFPTQIHIRRKNIPEFTFQWICLKTLDVVGLAITLVALTGSIYNLVNYF